jgi:hypothetical protein
MAPLTTFNIVYKSLERGLLLLPRPLKSEIRSKQIAVDEIATPATEMRYAMTAERAQASSLALCANGLIICR